MSFIVLTLGLLDVLAGIALWQPWIFSAATLVSIGWLMVVKGLYSMSMNALSQSYVDPLGWTDLGVGALLVLGWNYPFVWLLPVGKGVYSVMVFLAKWK